MNQLKRLTFSNKDVYNLFVKDEEIIEVRILNVYGKNSIWGNKPARGVVSGYFNNHNDFLSIFKKIQEEKIGSVFFTLQVIDPRLIARCVNKIRPSKITTSDNEVHSYRWILIDIDPNRPSGISSNRKELDEALEIMNTICAMIIAVPNLYQSYDKIEFKKIITALSGNGFHVLLELKQIVSATEYKDIISSILKDFNKKFSTDKVTIDTSVFNPARICKLYGTLACKGENFRHTSKPKLDRPHRFSHIIDIIDL